MGLLNGTGLNLGGLFGGLGGGVKGKTVTASTVGDAYFDTLSASDLMDADTVLKTTEFISLSSGYTIPFNQQISVGFGVASEPMHAGYTYMQLSDTTAVFYGKIRVIITDFNDIAKGVMFSADLKNLNGDLNDKNKKIMIPENSGKYAYFNDKIKLQCQGAVASTVDYNGDNTVIQLPITRRYLA